LRSLDYSTKPSCAEINPIVFSCF